MLQPSFRLHSERGINIQQEEHLQASRHFQPVHRLFLSCWPVQLPELKQHEGRFKMNFQIFAVLQSYHYHEQPVLRFSWLQQCNWTSKRLWVGFA